MWIAPVLRPRTDPILVQAQVWAASRTFPEPSCERNLTAPVTLWHTTYAQDFMAHKSNCTAGIVSWAQTMRAGAFNATSTVSVVPE